MSFPFDVEKALQAINVVLEHEAEQTKADSIDCIRLLKLLYIADRESLKETGSPITGDEVYAMDHGPVLSEVYNAIQDKSRYAAPWSHFIVRDGDKVSLSTDPGRAKLSRYDVEKLKEVTKRYHKTGTWQLVHITHKFPEWKKFYVPDTSTPIPLRSILESLGFAEAQIETIEREARSLSYAKQAIE